MAKRNTMTRKARNILDEVDAAKRACAEAPAGHLNDAICRLGDAIEALVLSDAPLWEMLDE